MVIFGIDPGIARTGFGVVRKEGQALTVLEYGVITTPPKHPPPQRLIHIYTHVLSLFDRHQPEVLVTERLYFGQNETTALGVGRTIGVVLLAAAQRAIPWVEYPPAAVKEAVVGYGAAEKRQVQYMVQRLLRLDNPPRPDDAADALAVAVCHAHSCRMRGIEEASGSD
ncbi:MAG: crossover junction endodeoxyribonuclease RuvC [Chthonomonadales bacterium]